jgi:hypothetical protein
MKLFTRILIMVIAIVLVGNVVVNACGDKDEIVLREKGATEKIDIAPDFPMVTSLIRF